MKSSLTFRLIIAGAVVSAAAFVLLLAQKTIVGKPNVAPAHQEDFRDSRVRPPTHPASTAGSNLAPRFAELASQNTAAPGADPKPAGDSSATPMQTAIREVLDEPRFVAFAVAASLPDEKRLKIAEILALTRLNSELAKRSGDSTVRSLMPGRVRKDAEVRALLQLTKEQRDIFAREHVISSLLPEDSPRIGPSR